MKGILDTWYLHGSLPAITRGRLTRAGLSAWLSGLTFITIKTQWVVIDARIIQCCVIWENNYVSSTIILFCGHYTAGLSIFWSGDINHMELAGWFYVLLFCVIDLNVTRKFLFFVSQPRRGCFFLPKHSSNKKVKEGYRGTEGLGHMVVVQKCSLYRCTGECCPYLDRKPSRTQSSKYK